MTAVELSEVVRNYAIVLGAAIGIAVAAWRAHAANRQAEANLSQAATSHRAYVTDVFSRAVGQLGDDRFEVRLGAIYTLRRVAEEIPDYEVMVSDLLSAYVRKELTTSGGEGQPELDVILDYIRRSYGEP